MIDLSKFCDPEGQRYNIDKPFSKGEWTYATNGHICVRVPRIANIPEVDTPDAAKLFELADGRGAYEWVEVPQISVSKFECDLCGGCGKYDDTPDDKCDECGGTGQTEESQAVRFTINEKEIGLSNIYLRLIKELPNPKIGLIEAAAISWRTHGKNKPSGTPVKFKFDGGDGLLMPMRF